MQMVYFDIVIYEYRNKGKKQTNISLVLSLSI